MRMTQQHSASSIDPNSVSTDRGGLIEKSQRDHNFRRFPS